MKGESEGRPTNFVCRVLLCDFSSLWTKNALL